MPKSLKTNYFRLFKNTRRSKLFYRKEKLSIASSFYEFVLFILWIGFGLAYLDSLLKIDSYWLKAIIFVDSFIVINWFYLLPFELYSTFKLNKNMDFQTSHQLLFIKKIL